MDVYNFFQSVDIAQHCKKIKHNFSPLETAIIVYLSDKPIKQKHEAYMQIINKYPDMPIHKSLEFKERNSLHEYLYELIEYENRTIESTMALEDGYVFSTSIWTADMGLDVREVAGYCSTFEIAKVEVLNMWKHYENKAIYADVVKISIGKKSGNKYVHINQNGEIIKAEDCTYNDFDLLENIYLNIPIPFETGDLVTFGDNRPYILREKNRWYNYGISKGEDICENVFFIVEKGLLSSNPAPWCTTFKMSYYKGELRGQEQFLSYFGKFIKEKSDDFDYLIALYMKYYLEEQGKRCNNNVENYFKCLNKEIIDL